VGQKLKIMNVDFVVEELYSRRLLGVTKERGRGPDKVRMGTGSTVYKTHGMIKIMKMFEDLLKLSLV
jgi:hypothetical protein